MNKVRIPKESHQRKHNNHHDDDDDGDDNAKRLVPGTKLGTALRSSSPWWWHRGPDGLTVMMGWWWCEWNGKYEKEWDAGSKKRSEILTKNSRVEEKHSPCRRRWVRWKTFWSTFSKRMMHLGPRKQRNTCQKQTEISTKLCVFPFVGPW